MGTHPAPEAASPQPGSAAGRRDRRWAVALPATLVLAALALRLVGLEEPERLYFDEVYYVADARALLADGVEDGFVVHPPLGKWLIAAGIAVAGDGPLGWRLASAVAGALLVGVTYAVGLRLLGRRSLAALAGLLVAVDGMALVSSRVAMLDGFLALLVAAAAWALLADGAARDGPGDPSLEVGPRPWRGWALGASPARWVAGGLLGLAVATKWAGLLAIGAAGLVSLVGDLLARRRATGRVLADPVHLLAGLAVPLLLVPAAVYLASYAGWFAGYEQTRPGQAACTGEPCEISAGERVAGWWGEQAAIARFHTDLDAEHPYRAGAWTWPLLTQPVAYAYETAESCDEGAAEADGPQDAEADADEAAVGDADDAPGDPAARGCGLAEGQVRHILAVGNPAVWWPAGLAVLALGWAAARHRRGDAGFLLAFTLGQWLPWLVVARPVFLFYTVPIVPFLALALAWGAAETSRSPRLRWLPAALAVGALLGLAFWYPIWLGTPIEEGAWRARILFASWY
ncbi:MAG: phospholipid carrier-dependent glycosyltransferase [Egibacteraceae bacterium]